ncbi:MAG: AAA family ATPase [Candidatus Lokiarchaeota archaeon]|nr:AAA family ATPase [Candidatus Lokiarchaeota archaeon]
MPLDEPMATVSSGPFSFGNLLGGGIFLTIIIAAWEKIKQFIWHFASYLICGYEFCDDFYKYGAIYVWDKLNNSKSLSPNYQSKLVGSGKEAKMLIREVGFNNFRIVKFGKVPTLAKIINDKAMIYGIKPFINHEKIMATALEHYHKYYSDFGKIQTRYCTTYVRGMLNHHAQKGLSSTDKGSDEQPKVAEPHFDLFERFNIGRRVNYTAGEYKRFTSFTNKNTKLIDNLHLTGPMTDLKKKLERWFKHKKWFLERSIQWKRGILIYGEPGTGKTSFIAALAEHFGVPLFVFDLATFTNDDMEIEWGRLKSSTPCFVVLEDFDSVFDGRKNVYANTAMTVRPLSFDCVLNILDGAVKYDGIVTFITTNNLNKIDEALSGNDNPRPGRIDYIYEMSGLTEDTKKFIAENIFNGMHDKQHLINCALNDVNSRTPAQFKELCINLALESYDKEDIKIIKEEIVKEKITHNTKETQ